MPHRHLGHQWLLDRTTEDGLDAAVTAHLLTNVVHDSHDRILVPPFGVLDGLDLAAHDNDLAGRHKLAPTICGAKVLRHAGWGDVPVESLGQARDKLIALAGCQGSWRVRSQDEVAVEVNHEGIVGRSEERAAFGSDTQDVWAGLLNELLGVAGMHHWHVQPTPLVNADAVANRLGGDGEDGRVVAHEDDAASG